MLKVVAAIPNYNMAKQLENLLPQLLGKGYSDIFVLDDASTDHSREIVAKFKGVIFVEGDANKGAGGNRNRVLSALDYEALIHFLDADVDLLTDDPVGEARQLYEEGKADLIGGLCLSKSGHQNPWNWGMVPNLYGELSAFVQARITNLYETKPKTAHLIRIPFAWLLKARPNIEKPPLARQVFWCLEQSMIIHSKTLRDIGGFDERLIENDAMGLSIRLWRHGLKCRFVPKLTIRHNEVEVRAYNRRLKKQSEKKIIIKEIGWLRFIGLRPFN